MKFLGKTVFPASQSCERLPAPATASVKLDIPPEVAPSHYRYSYLDPALTRYHHHGARACSYC